MSADPAAVGLSTVSRPPLDLRIRDLTTVVHETHEDAGRPVDPPTYKAIAVATLVNPCAGGPFTADLGVLVDLGATLAALLADRALTALAAVGVTPAQVRGYGKGAIIGTDGEIEHAAAILHPRFGAPVRAALGGGADIIPGTKKMGGPGASITMPIGNKDDRWVFDDMDAAEVSVADGPRASEMVVALVLAAGGRPHARVRKPASAEVK